MQFALETWHAPSTPVKLGGNAIHVWRCDENIAPQQLETLRKTLNSDELDRAKNFRFDHDRQRFILCRGILRELLSRYLNHPPKQFQFTYGPFGKPALAGQEIHFNISHTPGLCLLAFSASQTVGIDVEKVRPQENLLEIAHTFFHPDESKAIASAAPADRENLFFTHWTCKEARLKAAGLGIGRESTSIVNPSHEWLRMLNVGSAFTAAVFASTAPTDLQLLIVPEFR
jgi:4'-phosphopantetheinyl transferase